MKDGGRLRGLKPTERWEECELRGLDKETVVRREMLPCCDAVCEPAGSYFVRPAYELIVHDGLIYQAADVFSDTVPPFRYYQLPSFNTMTGIGWPE